MTYQTFEDSAHDGSPVRGYKFIGTFKTYRYTSAELDVSINSETYTALEISDEGVRTGTQEDDNFELQILLPLEAELVQDYGFDTPPPSLSAEVYEYHEGTNSASDWALIWKGEASSFSVAGRDARIRVPSIFSLALTAECPNRFNQAPCNHVLYDSRCKVVKDGLTQAFTTIATLIDSTSFIVANQGLADSFFRAGEVINLTKGERRTVIDNVAHTISFVYPFANAEVGDSIELLAGCNHALNGDCINKFNNAINFGGFAYVPGSNPFDGTL